MCRLYRVETKRLRGLWADAETEARRARDELEGFIPAAIGIALYEIALIRLRLGDLPAAEEALAQAHARGRDPEPGLSLLRLAQGRTAEAAASIARALEDPPGAATWGAAPGSDLNRVALLPAQVEIALAAGDVATARAAADELAALVARFPSTASSAASAAATGAVLLAAGDRRAAVRELRLAISRWGELEAPWEIARARLTLGEAYAAEGADLARLELEAARETFERLDARPDLRRAEAALDALAEDPDGGQPVHRAGRRERVWRTFVFTDIVDSTKLAEILGDEAWEQVIRWHDRTIRSLAAEHQGEDVTATGDGVFLAFADPGAAVTCAISIQRRFAEQRTAQGFAPGIRIGLHEAEASRSGRDYVGGGVNQAARIGGAAGAGEILASAATVAAARGSFAVADRRALELKGIAGPVDVFAID
jgi:class 3 adenylate cyclase